MIKSDSNTLMVTLTIEQFFGLQQKLLISHQENISNETRKILTSFMEDKGKVTESKNFVYGLKGLAKVLNVSKSTAARIKASGNLDDAIEQNGNIIRIDADLAAKLYYQKDEKKGFD